MLSTLTLRLALSGTQQNGGEVFAVHFTLKFWVETFSGTGFDSWPRSLTRKFKNLHGLGDAYASG
ncbi:uncharacterized protein QC763_704975 [Podospora pseudopauciseta]|uniref:Uncharacterized protein n=1 Tax=Podospora pseudopauciseta TaxID=2093780 RepID=A0ABR0GZC7_9PEZI|nr:hypothetical protein QC763_704975 [Podospora pseudopauciseta]